MVQGDPQLLGEAAAEVRLHLLRRAGLGEAQAARHPEDVGVHGQGGHPEGVGQHDVRGLLPDSGEGRELGRIPGHLSLVMGNQGLAQADQVAGLVAEEARGMDHCLQLCRNGLGQVVGGGVLREEPRRHEVHPGIGALGGEDGGHHQLEGVGMVQRAVCVRVGFVQAFQQLPEG
jgi:hypothetical protein